MSHIIETLNYEIYLLPILGKADESWGRRSGFEDICVA